MPVGSEVAAAAPQLAAVPMSCDAFAFGATGICDVAPVAPRNGAVGEATETVSVTVDLGTRYAVGEVIQVDSEKMLIEAISGNVLTVKRAYDGSLLASHLDNAAVNVFRSLTIVRGVNGTTAATHALAAAVVKYAPPADVWLYGLAKAILDHKQSQSGWTGQIGVGEGAVAVRAESIPMLREQLIQKYRPWWTIL